jgi:hypothetical protein
MSIITRTSITTPVFIKLFNHKYRPIFVCRHQYVVKKL